MVEPLSKELCAQKLLDVIRRATGEDVAVLYDEHTQSADPKAWITSVYPENDVRTAGILAGLRQERIMLPELAMPGLFKHNEEKGSYILQVRDAVRAARAAPQLVFHGSSPDFS